MTKRKAAKWRFRLSPAYDNRSYLYADGRLAMEFIGDIELAERCVELLMDDDVRRKAKAKARRR